jgi:hypothetical protein
MLSPHARENRLVRSLLSRRLSRCRPQRDAIDEARKAAGTVLVSTTTTTSSRGAQCRWDRSPGLVNSDLLVTEYSRSQQPHAYHRRRPCGKRTKEDVGQPTKRMNSPCQMAKLAARDTDIGRANQSEQGDPGTAADRNRLEPIVPPSQRAQFVRAVQGV